MENCTQNRAVAPDDRDLLPDSDLLPALEAILAPQGAGVPLDPATAARAILHLLADRSRARSQELEQELLSTTYAVAKEQALRRFEKGYVEALLRACDENISAAARKAGMDRSNFKRVLRKHREGAESAVAGAATPQDAVRLAG
jgi:DNA-binding NtrC family response regulator